MSGHHKCQWEWRNLESINLDYFERQRCEVGRHERWVPLGPGVREPMRDIVKMCNCPVCSRKRNVR